MIKHNLPRRTPNLRKAEKSTVVQPTMDMQCPRCSKSSKPNIEMEVFRSESGEFGITIFSPDTVFDTGPFASFDEVQNALDTLVNAAISGNSSEDSRLGVRRVVLAHAPMMDN